MKLKEIIKDLLIEGISKSQAKKLNLGDIVWVKYSNRRPAVDCEFIKFKPGDGVWKDRITVKGDDPGLNLGTDGIGDFPLTVIYMEDPEHEVKTRSGKGFLSKGVHGYRKWS